MKTGISYIKKHIIILGVFILIPFIGNSTANIIQHFNTSDGLSQNMVDCIYKDSRGFMWFGTWNGLNRFDGYEFVIYKNDPKDTTSLGNNFIYDIEEDQYGNLLIATEEGLNVLLYEEYRFIKPNLSLIQNEGNSIVLNVISVLDKNVWIGTEQGIKIISPINKNATFKLLNSQYNVSLCDSLEIHAFHGDSLGNMWIGTNNGLYKYDKETNSTYAVQAGFGNPDLFANNITSLFSDNDNYLWVGTSNAGVIRYNTIDHTHNWYFYFPRANNCLVHNNVTSITMNDRGETIIGTRGGISIFKEGINGFENIKTNTLDKGTISNNFVNCLFNSDDGNIWIGTERGGIDKLNFYKKKFHEIISDTNDPGLTNTVNSVLDEEDNLWIGTSGGGLIRHNKTNGQRTIYKASRRNKNALGSNFITALHRDNKGDLYVGTWGGSIATLSIENQDKGIFNRFDYNPDNPFSIIHPFISSITEDSLGRLWIGTPEGLDIYYKENQLFYHVSSEKNNSFKEIGCLQFDRNGNLWIGTVHGLYEIKAKRNKLINPSKIEYKVFQNNANGVNSFSSNYVISICEDTDGELWFGTYGNGIITLQLEPDGSYTFENFNEEDGLSSNIVYGILNDSKENLWLSTEHGLSKFNIKTSSFKNYYQSDGLLSSQFYWAAAYKNKKGTLFFGNMEGLNYFHPDSIQENTVLPQVTITDLRVANESVKVGDIYNGIQVLEKSISVADKMTISDKSKDFTFEFSALHYDQPENNRYKYILEGYDDDWQYVTSKRRYVTYTNLDGGTYVFKVYATNNDGKWSDEPAQITISIVPPFWRAWWFPIGIFVLLLILVFGYNRFRLYTLRIQKEKLEEKVNQRTARINEQKKELEHKNKQIEEQKKQVEEQNSEILAQHDNLVELNKKVELANEKKIQFFTNISHEFRTPLTLILSPLEQLIVNTNLPVEITHKHRLMYKNAKRLMNLINQLVELRKVEIDKTELRTSKNNIVPFVKDISQSFYELAHKKNITFLVQSNQDVITTYFDHEKIEAIVYNLLSNAFKYTNEGGNVDISIVLCHPKTNKQNEFTSIVTSDFLDSHSDKEYIEINVQDTGIGVAKNKLYDIFKLFYRDPAIENTIIQGSGIGLSLIKELIKVHKGALDVKSKEGIGSTFRIQLPLHKDYLLPDEIIENNNILMSNKNNFQTITNIHNVAKTESEIKIEAINEALPLLLIVEDHIDIRDYLADQLKNSYRILCAGNGAEGLEFAREKSPDIIISDILMPVIDGLQMCSKLKEDIATSHIPIILLTSKSSIEDQITGFDTGADDYIPKPFSVDLLQSRIKNIIKNRTELRKLFLGNIIPKPEDLTTNKSDEQFLIRAMQIVSDNIENPSFDIETFSQNMNVSKSLLHKKLVAIVGMSPYNFVLNLRMKKAATMLGNSDLSITNIAYKIGFTDPKYFSRYFRKFFNQSPTEYAKKIKTE